MMEKMRIYLVALTLGAVLALVGGTSCTPGEPALSLPAILL